MPHTQRQMLSTELQAGICNGPLTLVPRWLKTPFAVSYSGICRAQLYRLANELGEDGRPKIQSICIKSHKGATRGVRLFDRESIDKFMLSLQAQADAERGGVS
jgi:hypothetical protein